jgi:formamidopyrimidine-DNA glycosylase
MPELPEVQTIVSDLKRRIVGEKIADFWTDTPRIIKNFSPNNFKKEVIGFKIAEVRRRGKNILFYLEKTVRKRKDKKIMLAHQKMTGHFLIGRWRIRKISKNKFQIIPAVAGPVAEDKYNGYLRLIFKLDNGWELGLSDLRKFARITVGSPSKIEHSREIASLGPDALSPKFSPKYLFSLLQKRKKLIKPILLEQNVMAGVGNIYADEALFLAKINPQRKAADLKRLEVERLVKSIKKVLQKSIRLKGTSVIDYRDTYGRRGKYDKVRWVYDKEKLPCRICRTLIKRVKIGQRSSYFCPSCQK